MSYYRFFLSALCILVLNGCAGGFQSSNRRDVETLKEYLDQNSAMFTVYHSLKVVGMQEIEVTESEFAYSSPSPWAGGGSRKYSTEYDNVKKIDMQNDGSFKVAVSLLSQKSRNNTGVYTYKFKSRLEAQLFVAAMETLCPKVQYYEPAKPVYAESKWNSPKKTVMRIKTNKDDTGYKTLLMRLRELKKQRNDGQISPEKYKSSKRKYLGEYNSEWFRHGLENVISVVKKGDVVRILDQESAHYEEIGIVHFLSTGGALVVEFEGSKFPISIAPDLVELVEAGQAESLPE